MPRTCSTTSNIWTKYLYTTRNNTMLAVFNASTLDIFIFPLSHSLIPVLDVCTYCLCFGAEYAIFLLTFFQAALIPLIPRLCVFASSPNDSTFAPTSSQSLYPYAIYLLVVYWCFPYRWLDATNITHECAYMSVVVYVHSQNKFLEKITIGHIHRQQLLNKWVKI